MSRLYAHRGAAAEEPENTLASFERAASYGVHGLEMDVHMSADGVVVVSHDSDGQRMCRESRAIKKTSFAELSEWDAGWGFVSANGDRPFAERDYRIPRFAEILDSFPDLVINVDLKQSAPSMVKKVLKIVRQAKAQDRVILASFSQTTLLHLRYRGYRGVTALGALEVGSAIYLPPRLVRAMPFRGQAAQIPVRAGKLVLATPKRIARIQASGARVDFWTINDVEEARSLLAMGADGIMTDDPKALAELF